MGLAVEISVFNLCLMLRMIGLERLLSGSGPTNPAHNLALGQCASASRDGEQRERREK